MILGEPDHRGPEGARYELRFFSDQNPVIVVHSNLIRSINNRQSAGAVDYLSVSLEGPRGSGIAGLPRIGVIELWCADNDDTELILAARTQIDWCEATYDKETERTQFEGRSVCAQLIDQRCDIVYSGGLLAGLSGIAHAHGVSLEAPDLDDSQQVDFYAAAPSAYGLIRLVCGAAGLLLSATPIGIRIESISRAKKRLYQGPAVTLSSDEVTSGKVESGRRVRKRS